MGFSVVSRNQRPQLRATVHCAYAESSNTTEVVHREAGMQDDSQDSDWGSGDEIPEDSDDVVAQTSDERAALVVVNAYMHSFNEKNVAGTNEALHFPHIRFARGGVHIIENPDSIPNDFFERFAISDGWFCSRWDYRRAIQSCPDKVHFAVQFTRYREDGSVIGRYPSMWIVTLRDGQWGVVARSSFAP